MVYPIVKYGDAVLEKEAENVTEFDTPELHKLIEDMFESMYAAKGVGLAAPQIGISKKIAVIDCSNGEHAHFLLGCEDVKTYMFLGCGLLILPLLARKLIGRG